MAEARRASQAAAVDSREAMLQFIHAGHVSQCVYVVAKLGVADFLNDGPKTCDELAVETSVHAPSLHRVMRALAGLGIFCEEQDGRFALTPLAEPLRSDAERSVRDWAVMRGEEFVWRPWGAILESVRTGASAFRHVFEKGPFEYLQQDQEAAQIFDRAMRSISAGKFAAVAGAYNFSGIQTLVDVAGGTGGLLIAILKANPGMKGVLADQPHVIGRAQGEIAAAGLADRCRCAEIDMFESVPEGGDAYILGNIIHDWDEERAIQILRNCRRAMRPGSKLLLVELAMAPPNEPHLSKLADLEMMAMTDGGRERSESEYGALYEAAGFRLTRVVGTPSPWSVIEGVAV
jgi:O-methyltransferase domain/Dimerisation domain